MSEELDSLKVKEIQWPLTEEQESQVCLIYSIYEQYVTVFIHTLNDRYLCSFFFFFGDDFMLTLLTESHRYELSPVRY